ncbi:MAG: MATE family efflux transporter [Spirochaetes bacterium]|nr:MAG: MATE family efflux transporter [Spirochaetota bacterium]
MKLTGPMMIGMIGMVIFNLVDTLYIGRLGTQALAAMSFTLPVVLLQGSISMGLGVGASSVISRAVGAGNHTLVKRLTTDSLFLSVLIVIVFVIPGLLTIEPLFRLLGAEGPLLQMVKQYMQIWYVGVPFVVIPMIGNGAIRAAGNTLIPSIIMLTSIVVNIVLDPLLIFGIGPFPRMELAGAALATVFARSTTLVVSLLVLRFRFDMLTAHIPSWRALRSSWGSVLYIGLPAALTQVIRPFSMAVITRMVAGYGAAAVAALGVGTRVEMFIMAPLMALAAVMIPFTGQNLGAGRPDRVKSGLSFGFRFNLILGTAAFFLLLITGRWIGKIFNPDPEVVRIVGLYLVIVSAGYGLQGVLQLSTNTFSALGKPYRSAALNLLRMFGLYIPLALLGSRLFGLPGIFTGASLSAIIAGILGAWWVKRSV